MTENIIQLEHIYKEFSLGKNTVQILKDVNTTIRRGEFVAIMGASGSGKSTLLNIIGCLDQPTDGSYLLDGQLINDLNDDELARFRNLKLGFVFQNFNLLPYYTAQRNVEVPLSYQNRKDRSMIAKELLERVGLGHRLNHKPTEMSGGEKQRIAIARALSTNPDLLLADEPTGALDSQSGIQVMGLFKELHREGKTIIMVTHDREIGEQAERIIMFKDGRIENGDTGNHSLSPRWNMAQ
ncbi:ABC transporter ATP-binding protein [Desulfosporosinus metallidurans]|uniref:Cell division transporter, ATP-binding protein FtsE n=1 Tax=Desulfosporosinus metallidurans TaxID=1888891 RepID=A0A1Q8R051_9FIRM|nr:ABC transporter ATP-binding protein [Desulfosporosinus metallidurans]OLN33008.1 Cell division transporter, ATP-binding protein FtsE [Desulfosporosinus metallidurans]